MGYYRRISTPASRLLTQFPVWRRLYAAVLGSPSCERITTSFTFWVDKQSRLVRKYTSSDDGELLPTDPAALCSSETEGLYPVAELNPSSFPDGTFAFTSPVTAVLVKQVQDKHSLERSKLVGKPLPSVTLKAPDGQEISFQSFLSKPLLRDFFGPLGMDPAAKRFPISKSCIRKLKRKALFSLVSMKTSSLRKLPIFGPRTKSRVSTTIAHRDGQNTGKFPSHGISYFVLVDSSGNVFSPARASMKMTCALPWLRSLPPPFTRPLPLPDRLPDFSFYSAVICP